MTLLLFFIFVSADTSRN